MRRVRGLVRVLAATVRALLLLVLSITALAATGLWAYSRGRTIDTTYSMLAIHDTWALRLLHETFGIELGPSRVIVVRGSLHVIPELELRPIPTSADTLHVVAEQIAATPMWSHSFNAGPISLVLGSKKSNLVIWGYRLSDTPTMEYSREVVVHGRCRLWLVILLAAAYPVWTLWRRPARIRSRRTRRGLCGGCGYNLHGNTSGVCPECGCAVRPVSGGFLIEQRTIMATCAGCGQTVDRSPGGAGGGVCASCGMTAASVADSKIRGSRWYSLPEMRYQNLYVWNVLVAALDVMLTMAVIYGHGGYEVNPIAAAVIGHMGIPGAVGLKFGIVLLVIIICEVVGRRDDRAGRRLATAALVINSLPVAYTFGLLTYAVAL